MPSIKVDINTFEHALKNLNKQDILLILQKFHLGVESKQKKEELVNYLMESIRNNNVSEDMYYMIREKAFSINKNFYDGFFFEIDNSFKELNLDKFKEIMIEKAKESKSDNLVSVSNYRIHNSIITFSFEKSKKNSIYDSDEQISRIYRQVVNAEVQIYLEYRLVYIHSKNLTESQTIKAFLEKCLKSLKISGTKKKKALIEPKFNETISEKWFKDNEEHRIFRIDNISLHMLDLLYQFDCELGKFSSICMRGIYLKEDLISGDNEESKITDVSFGGVALQENFEILTEIKNGKRILGFKIEVEYLYEDEDTDEIIPTMLPITILYEDKQYLRISIASQQVNTIKEVVLIEAYYDVKNLFIKKFLSNNIFNEVQLIEYLSKKTENSVTEKVNVKNEEKIIPKNAIQQAWSF